MMKQRGGIVTILVTLALALGFALAPGCGGGGSDGVVTSVLIADFIPTNSAPPANSLSMQEGSTSQATFSVAIKAKDVNDFFGAAFHVTFDTTKVSFVTYSSTTSFLRDGGIATGNLRFNVNLQSGELLIDATRIQDATGTIPGVDVVGSRDLLVLTFRATAATGGSSSPISFADPRLVCDSSQPVCTSIPVTYFGGSVLAN